MALGVLAIVLIPFAGMFYGGATSAASNREYGDAVAIANGVLAKADSITYANLGFYSSQAGYVSSYHGQPTVNLGASPPAGVTPQLQANPGTAQQVGAIVFTSQTYVVWVDGSGGKSYAYKQVYAVVSWLEQGTRVQAVQSVLVYPGGLGPYTGPQNTAPSGTSSTPDNIANLATSLPADPAGETTVTLTWDLPAHLPANGIDVVEWAPDPNGRGSLATPDTSGTSGGWAPSGSSTSASFANTATTFNVTGLAPNTHYWFEVVAFSPDGAQWAVSENWVDAITLSPPVLPCTPGTLTVSQAGQSAGLAQVSKSTSHLMSALTMTLTYSGTCTNLADTMTVDATSSGEDPGSPYTLSWGATQYTYTLCPSTGFITGTHTYTVWHNGVQTNVTAQVSFSQQKTGSPAC